jgi:hypothetical protein
LRRRDGRQGVQQAHRFRLRGLILLLDLRSRALLRSSGSSTPVEQHTELLLGDVALAREPRTGAADLGGLVLLSLHGPRASCAEAGELRLDARCVCAEGGVEECLDGTHGLCCRWAGVELDLKTIVVLLEALVD